MKILWVPSFSFCKISGQTHELEFRKKILNGRDEFSEKNPDEFSRFTNKGWHGICNLFQKVY